MSVFTSFLNLFKSDANTVYNETEMFNNNWDKIDSKVKKIDGKVGENTTAIGKNKNNIESNSLAIGENTTAIGENTTAIGENTTAIGERLEKGDGLVAANARALEKQIENLNYYEEFIKIHSGNGTFPHSSLDEYTEILVSATGTGAGARFAVRKDITLFKQNLPNFKIVIRDDDQVNLNHARLTTDGVTVTPVDVNGCETVDIYGIKKTIR